MEVKFYCPHWGSKHLPFQKFVAKVKEGGFQGVEMSLPLDRTERNEILSMLKDFELELIGQHWETNEKDFRKYKPKYEKHIRKLFEGNPVFINSQTGKDYFTFDQNLELIQMAQKLSSEAGIKIIHETHRGKFSFACHILAPFLEKDQDFRLCLDVSHWFNVAESDLNDQQENLKAAIARTDHIHSRVGFSQGPQINDPRGSEWNDILNQHLEVWDQVIEHHRAAGSPVFTITTEFGPPPYMPVVPLTRQPITSQWEVNIFMKDLLRIRYNKINV